MLFQYLILILDLSIIFVIGEKFIATSQQKPKQKGIIILSPSLNITCDKTRTWRNVRNGIIKSKIFLFYKSINLNYLNNIMK